MRKHVFSKMPIFAIGLQPALLLVKCPCGRVHKEYFGPKDLDTRKMEIKFLEKQLVLAFKAMRHPKSTKKRA